MKKTTKAKRETESSEELEQLALELLEDDDESPSDTERNTISAQTNHEIEETQFKVVQERNDFYIGQITHFVEQERWINIRPEYQRRRRWDNRKKSLLIESLLLNIPVPPVFLYEASAEKLEVMDGQQRVNAIIEFMNDDLRLSNLTVWPELNGRTFSECSKLIRTILPRRKLSAISLAADIQWAKALESRGEHGRDLRRMVFQRLNTGGEKLNAQELRNCLWGGEFNKLIVRLASESRFTKIWKIPPATSVEDDQEASTKRIANTLYKSMGDCQIVLRFFAFRNPSEIRGSVRSSLDRAMQVGEEYSSARIQRLEKRYLANLKTAEKIFGDAVFRLTTTSGGAGRLSVPLYDAVMVSLDQLRSRHSDLVASSDRARKAVERLLRPQGKTREIIVGRPNRAAAIRSRIKLVQRALESVLP